MVWYPVTLSPDDNDTVLVGFPDFPEAQTFGDDESEALTRAVDALETVIDAYIRDRRAIPASRSPKGPGVKLPALVAAKVLIYNEMLHQNIGKSDMGKRLGVHLPQVDRLLDVRHGSRLDQLEAAAHALGSHLDVVLVAGHGTQLVIEAKPSVRTSKARKAPQARRPVHAGVLRSAKAAKLSSSRLVFGGKKK